MGNRLVEASHSHLLRRDQLLVHNWKPNAGKLFYKPRPHGSRNSHRGDFSHARKLLTICPLCGSSGSPPRGWWSGGSLPPPKLEDGERAHDQSLMVLDFKEAVCGILVLHRGYGLGRGFPPHRHLFFATAGSIVLLKHERMRSSRSRLLIWRISKMLKATPKRESLSWSTLRSFLKKGNVGWLHFDVLVVLQTQELVGDPRNHIKHESLVGLLPETLAHLFESERELLTAKLACRRRSYRREAVRLLTLSKQAFRFLDLAKQVVLV